MSAPNLIGGGRRPHHFAAIAMMSLWMLPASFGLDPSMAANTYLHNSWTRQDEGPLREVTSLAETKDGYLWLVAGTGLLRFDGLNFSTWRPLAGETWPGDRIKVVCATSDGDLWVGTSGGVSRLRKGHLTNFSAKQGLPEGEIQAIIADERGRVLAGLRRQGKSDLAAIDPSSGKIELLATGIPPILALFEDRRHVLWIGTEQGLCHYVPGDNCRSMTLAGKIRSVGQNSLGELFAAQNQSRGIAVAAAGASQFRSANEFGLVSGSVMYTDRDGTLWMGTLGSGLFARREGKVENLVKRDGLSSEIIYSLLEDRDGNLWIGTSEGLDRLRNPITSSLPLSTGIQRSRTTVVTSTREGAVWVGTVGDGLVRFKDGEVTRFTAGLPGSMVISVYADPLGNTWAGTTEGLAYLVNGKSFSRISLTQRATLEPGLRHYRKRKRGLACRFESRCVQNPGGARRIFFAGSNSP